MPKVERDRLAAEIAAVDGILATTPANDILGRLSLTSWREELQEQLEAEECEKPAVDVHIDGRA